jgi:putative membrane protein
MFMNNNENKIKTDASDHLANERTFLAWIRTSIALMGLGFVVVKFSLFIRQMSLAVTGHPLTAVKGSSGVIGICLVAIGAFFALISYLRYERIKMQIINQAFCPSSKLLLGLTAGLICASLLLLYYLLPSI